MLKISVVYLCRRISFFFFFVSFAFIILFRSFTCSATIYRRYRESIIVCINIIPFYKNENAPDTSGSKRPVRAYVHVSLDPVAWIHQAPDRSITLKEQEYPLSSLFHALALYFLPLYFVRSFFFISNFIIHGRHLERSCTYFNVLTHRQLRISIIFFDYEYKLITI